ncbi:hypothetical protein C8Q74DRAFT_1416832 [Fomes fomentarius]|nr:hypothetical protein C8Q74DRAFT_1416832 [Fomes fomentarius]
MPGQIQVEFVIIGGSICGLSTAIALARVGHKVTLFDITNPFEPTPLDGGCRLPPNSTKMYYRWGLEERLRKCAIKSRGRGTYGTVDSGSVIASQDWEEEMMEEIGGDFLLVHVRCGFSIIVFALPLSSTFAHAVQYTHLRETLAEFAEELGATIRHGPEAEVVSVHADPQRPSVTLKSGEIVYADVVVGADGNYWSGCTRRELMDVLEQEDEHEPTGIAVYNSIIPDHDLDRVEDKVFLEKIRGSGRVFTWFGTSEHGAQIYPIKQLDGEPLLMLCVYTTHKFDGDEEKEERVYDATVEMLLDELKDADEELRQLASHATRISCMPIYERPALEDWVHPDGRIICIGEAAHPTPVGSTYTFGMSTGDAAVLGRLFTHLHRKEQIDSFLNAVQEIRQSRVENVIRASTSNVFAVSLPPGLAETHDRQMRERAMEGAANLSRRRGQSSEEMMQVIEMIFGYDPEDEADDWWFQWGVMQERAAYWTIMDQPFALVTEEALEELAVAA